MCWRAGPGGERINIQNILLAMDELERWQKRKEALERDLMGLEDEVKKGVLKELEKVKIQIAYYQDLIKDMKKKFSPPTLIELAKK